MEAHCPPYLAAQKGKSLSPSFMQMHSRLFLKGSSRDDFRTLTGRVQRYPTFADKQCRFSRQGGKGIYKSQSSGMSSMEAPFLSYRVSAWHPMTDMGRGQNDRKVCSLVNKVNSLPNWSILNALQVWPFKDGAITATLGAFLLSPPLLSLSPLPSF